MDHSPTLDSEPRFAVAFALVIAESRFQHTCFPARMNGPADHDYEEPDP
jgi:hypothetical protein